MKEIILHNGMRCKVDDSNFEELSKFPWAGHQHKNGTWYAERTKTGKVIAMHRQIMGFPEGLLVDHIDHDGLNNQKVNLRIATRAQNNANRRAASTNQTSKYLGVAFEKDRKRWTARIRKDWKGYRLGSFDSEIEAAIAYNEAAIRLHGEFANINKIQLLG